MKRSLRVGSFLAAFLSVGIFAKHSGSVVDAATTGTGGHMAPIRCNTSAQLLSALAIARTTANVVIELQPIEYAFQTELVVQGNGTTIHGNGATIVTSAYYSGFIDPLTKSYTQGTAIVVKPLLGTGARYNRQTSGFWYNPHGNCTALNLAAGGAPQTFYEQAPCQDASTTALSTYSLCAPYVVPAKNITIQDINVRFASRFCDSAVYVTYSQNVTVSNIKVVNVPSDLGPGGGHGDIWGLGSQNVMYSSCSGPIFIALNSCTASTVTGCDLNGVSFEEMCRTCTVSDNQLITCRTNDILCSDITFDSNSFSGTGDNVGCLWGGTRMVFKNNTVDGAVWLGNDTRKCTLSGNTGPAFYNYARASAGNIATVNTITH